MIRLQIIGNLGKDAETKQINGKNYLSFSVCHTERYTDSSGQQQSRSTWIDCLKRDDNGKLGKYLKKGVKVFAEGTPKSNGYASNDGTIKTSISMLVYRLELISGSSENKQQDEQHAHPITGKVHHKQPVIDTDANDDLPF